MKIKVSNIEWDTSDGYDGSDLPSCKELELTDAIDLTEVLDEIVADVLSEEHGYPVNTFEIEVV